MRIRTLVTLVILTVFWDMVYRFLPNRRHKTKTTFRKQLPGAAFTACGWLLISFVFSIYLGVTGQTCFYFSFCLEIQEYLW